MKLWRKLFHLLGLGALFYFWMSKKQAITVMLILLALDLIIEVFRTIHKEFQREFFARLSHLLRRSEKYRPLGITWFLLGMLANALLFEKNIAVLGVIMLTFGDPLAEIIGRKYGRHALIGKKTLEGFLACFAGALASGLAFGCLAFGMPFIPVIAGALAASITELLTFKGGDNLLIPIISGLAMALLI